AFCAALTLVPSCFAGSKVLYNFYPPVGGLSKNPLYRDAVGNLYGMTQLGGLYNYGTVFVLSQQPSGQWQDTTLHAYTNEPGDSGPVGGLTADAAGNLYGANGYGTGNLGGVFQLSPMPGGGWNYKLIYKFRSGK